MPYGWKILYNGADISAKVGQFSIRASLESYCREMSLDIVDRDFYAGLDFSAIPETPDIEIFTKVGASFVSQGTFFLERPALSVSVQSETLNGIWGRSKTAALGEPFSPKVSKMWTEKTTFFAVCEEMCGLAGIAWDDAYSEIDDFAVYPYTLQADSVYPVDVLTELATLAGALVTTDREDHVCIKRIDYAPAAADATVTDVDIRDFSETPEWPTFGNRVRITPSGSLAGYSVSLSIPSPCLPADGSSWAKLFAQVKDADGLPVNNLAVAWSIDSVNAVLSLPATNTQEIIVEREQQRAKTFYTVEVDLVPSTVDGVFAYSDLAREEDLAESGYTIDGNTIILTEQLAYCDQLLVIAYRSAGVAINYLSSGLAAEDVIVTADVEGERDSGTVYIDNPCKCSPMISLKAYPSSIHPGEVASLLVYVEESGPATAGRTVFMSEKTAAARGTLEWTSARLGTVVINNEQATARNEITGTTQCEIPMFPAAVTSVYRADEAGLPIGVNIYASHAGKLIDLSAEVESGTDLLVNYTAQGGALNRFTGAEVGNARIVAYIATTKEEGAEASASISILDVNEAIEDKPEDAADDGAAADPGGSDGTYDPKEGALCRKSDGTEIKCAAGEKCCWKGTAFGCFKEAECDTTRLTMNRCFPKNVSADPSAKALGARFDSALAYKCTCEEICDNEFRVYDTTQNYNNASYRKISQIVVKDFGFAKGSPEYHEKYEVLKQAALAACKTACEAIFAFDDASTPDTIAPGGSIQAFVLNGCPPFSWSVSGLGYSLAAAVTAGRSNQLNCASGACGTNYGPVATITVKDGCGGSVSAVIRNTSGEWNLRLGSVGASPTYSNCGQYPGDFYEEYTSGTKRWRILHHYCMKGYAPTSAWTNADWVPAFNPPCGLPNECGKIGTCTAPGCIYYADYIWYYDNWVCA